MMVEYIKILFIKSIDCIWFLILIIPAFVMRITRRLGVGRMPLSNWVLNTIGVFPILNHYYEPQFIHEYDNSLENERNLPGIDWNINCQLNFINKMNFEKELITNHDGHLDQLKFDYNNNTFGSGDAEYFYQIIRLLKPKKIFEIGSGNSTKMAILAINKNKSEDNDYACRHLCIEPFEMPWLDSSGVELLRRKVEDLGVDFFSELGSGDILFIDSSHIIRPQGDVLFEYLELLPTLNKGVIVHIHDIFSPKNYLPQWLINDHRFWNEQYLLEAFLSNNNCWEIIGSLNYLKTHYYSDLSRVAPFLTSDRSPGSFYIRCIK